MDKHYCFIGMLYNYENTELVDYGRLKYLVAEHYTIFTMKDYCDLRRSTDLHRFKYCPECGREIDWRTMRRLEHAEE